ncbi:MAG: TolC family protein [Myxococcales bacterium]|nr:TolC family protein [Myxococcales bacterium]
MRSKTPIDHRIFVLALLAAWPGGAAAEGACTVEDAVRRAVQRPEAAALLEGRLQGARAALAAQTVVPTPTLAGTVERVGDPAATEATVLVEQAFDLSGWRGRLRETLPHVEGAVRADVEASRLAQAVAVRHAFFEVRYRQARAQALDGWIERLEGSVAAVRAREARGDVARYEVRRVQRELETAQARRAGEAARLAEAWAALGAHVPWSSRPELVGSLAPEAPPGGPTAAPLPHLARLAHQQQALAGELDAAGSPLWRGWRLGAGYRRVDEPAGTGHGLVVSLAVPLALWDTEVPRRRRACGPSRPRSARTCSSARRSRPRRRPPRGRASTRPWPP